MSVPHLQEMALVAMNPSRQLGWKEQVPLKERDSEGCLSTEMCPPYLLLRPCRISEPLMMPMLIVWLMSMYTSDSFTPWFPSLNSARVLALILRSEEQRLALTSFLISEKIGQVLHMLLSGDSFVRVWVPSLTLKQETPTKQYEPFPRQFTISFCVCLGSKLVTPLFSLVKEKSMMLLFLSRLGTPTPMRYSVGLMQIPTYSLPSLSMGLLSFLKSSEREDRMGRCASATTKSASANLGLVCLILQIIEQCMQ